MNYKIYLTGNPSNINIMNQDLQDSMKTTGYLNVLAMISEELIFQV